MADLVKAKFKKPKGLVRLNEICKSLTVGDRVLFFPNLSDFGVTGTITFISAIDPGSEIFGLTIDRDDGVGGAGFNNGWFVYSMDRFYIKKITTQERGCSICGDVIEEIISDIGLCKKCIDNLPICEMCGARGLPEDIYFIEGRNICYNCLSSKYSKCKECDSYFRNELLIEDLCELCIDNYTRCSVCKRLVPKHSIITKGDFMLKNFGKGGMCYSCYNEIISECSLCHKESFKKDSILVMIRKNKTYVCKTCYEEGFIRCDSCNEIHEYNFVITKSDDTNICKTCFDNSIVKKIEIGRQIRANKIDKDEIKERILKDTLKKLKISVTCNRKDKYLSDLIDKINKIAVPRFPLYVYGLRDRDDGAEFSISDSLYNKIKHKKLILDSKIETPLGMTYVRGNQNVSNSLFGFGISLKFRETQQEFLENLIVKMVE